MNNNVQLANRHCLACESGQPSLKASAIEVYLKELNTPWQALDNKKIKHDFKFKDFLSAIDFVNELAKIAEAEGHHPDIYIFYNLVTIELWTHAIGGLSENDFIMATKIEGLFEDSKEKSAS